MVHYQGYNMRAIADQLREKLGGTKKALENQTGIAGPTIKKLLDGESATRSTCKTILEVAKQELPPSQLDDCRVGQKPLYDPSLSFTDNYRRGPCYDKAMLPTSAELPKCPHTLWGKKLDSPFGASASCITMNSQWVEVLARAGADVITYKTVRTRSCTAHDLPHNLGYIVEPVELLVADDDPGNFPVQLQATSDWRRRLPGRPYGMANCFGMPSQEPEAWKVDVARSVKLLNELSPGKLLILSVVGTADGNDPQALIDDFAHCVEIATQIETHFPQVIELNLSCPHTYGREGTVFQNPELARSICERANQVIETSGKGIRLLAKIGYLPKEDLYKLCDEVAEFVDGFSAINTRPTEILGGRKNDGRKAHYFAQDEITMPFKKAGVSGTPLCGSAFWTIKELRSILDHNGQKDKVIFGMGGVSNPEDVRRYMDAGASVVQATTEFINNLRLAAEVRQFLAAPSHWLSQDDLTEFHANILDVAVDRDEAQALVRLLSKERLRKMRKEIARARKKKKPNKASREQSLFKK